MEEFNLEIIYRPSKLHTNADGLSHLSCTTHTVAASTAIPTLLHLYEARQRPHWMSPEMFYFLCHQGDRLFTPTGHIPISPADAPTLMSDLHQNNGIHMRDPPRHKKTPAGLPRHVLDPKCHLTSTINNSPMSCLQLGQGYHPHRWPYRQTLQYTAMATSHPKCHGPANALQWLPVHRHLHRHLLPLHHSHPHPRTCTPDFKSQILEELSRL